jgi:hypothetical protein
MPDRRLPRCGLHGLVLSQHSQFLFMFGRCFFLCQRHEQRWSTWEPLCVHWTTLTEKARQRLTVGYPWVVMLPLMENNAPESILITGTASGETTSVPADVRSQVLHLLLTTTSFASTSLHNPGILLPPNGRSAHPSLSSTL